MAHRPGLGQSGVCSSSRQSEWTAKTYRVYEFVKQGWLAPTKASTGSQPLASGASVDRGATPREDQTPMFDISHGRSAGPAGRPETPRNMTVVSTLALRELRSLRSGSERILQESGADRTEADSLHHDEKRGRGDANRTEPRTNEGNSERNTCRRGSEVGLGVTGEEESREQYETRQNSGRNSCRNPWPSAR